jgi:DDE family transposase
MDSDRKFDCRLPINLNQAITNKNRDDDNSYHILTTNKLNSSAKMVIASYLLRWGIEHCFKELKNTFHFDHYQFRHINKIERYRNLFNFLTR